MRDYIEGDLLEVYDRRVKESGKRKADWKFILDVLLLFRPGIIRPKKTYQNLNTYGMYKSYFKIGWRNLMKDKVFSLINVSGLTLGITVCLMIFIFVADEFSVDRFHSQGDNIYRVKRAFSIEGKQSSVAYLSGMYGPALLNDFGGEIERAVRVKPMDGLVTIETKSFQEKKIVAVDEDFFSLFSFPLLRGNAGDVLKYPESVVLTESSAKRYFGSIDNAMDQVIELNQRLSLKVTGIVADVGSSSHLEFDLVLPLSNYKDEESMNYWISNSLYTYVLLAPQVDKSQLEGQLVQFMDKYLGAELKKFGFNWELSLMPLEEVYFDSSPDGARHGDKTTVFIFVFIAALILMIGCINFMNLSTIRGADRSKEVGLRKVMGAQRSNLIGQFIGESVLITGISCILSIGLLMLFMPWYNNLLGYTLTVSLHSFHVYVFLLSIIVVVGLLAGSYPAFFLSAFSPVQALKGKLKLGNGGAVFRQALVVIQFSVSVFLIVGTTIIAKQMRYVKNKELGYDAEQTLVVAIDNADIYKNLSQFKSLLQKESSIQSVSVMSGEPGGFFDGQMFEVEGLDEKWNARTQYADFDYVSTLGLKLIAGRDFSPGLASDSLEAVLINRTAASKLGWTPEQALDKWIKNTVRDQTKRRIIGVVEDFNFQSLMSTIEALVISPNEDWRTILIKASPGSLSATIATVEQAYARVAPAYPLEYHFLDQQFDRLYKSNLRQQTVLTIFANVAILVACLGLFGLASFTTKMRFKEIGVRKVLGSSVQSIVVLLSKDLLKPVCIAVVIGLPVGHYAMRTWLENFAYQTTLDWWVFALAAVSTLGIALLTVCYQAVKSATANPVRSLRPE
ncbi:ABC transporter permease [Algoriphagus jejuensis]|uniref:ABC transporter permease n=2 Tax=Algoriphagus jejuensis TaxID=419934 RepID=A0ABP3YHQ7_9BACT